MYVCTRSTIISMALTLRYEPFKKHYQDDTNSLKIASNSISRIKCEIMNLESYIFNDFFCLNQKYRSTCCWLFTQLRRFWLPK